MDISQQELNILSDTEYLLLKRDLLQKIEQKFGSISNSIDMELKKLDLAIPPEYLQVVPKISRGENYQGLPYMVLDNPRYFTKENVFSYRVMMWWGNFFSFSFQLKGPLVNSAVKSLYMKKIAGGHEISGIWFCINHSPWEHHFESSNFMPLKELSEDDIRSHVKEKEFIKIAKKAPLKEWPFLNDFAIRNLQLFTELFNLRRRS